MPILRVNILIGVKIVRVKEKITYFWSCTVKYCLTETKRVNLSNHF